MINISTLVDIFARWIVVLQDLWDVFNRSVTSFMFPSATTSVTANLVIKFLDVTGLGDYTLLEFMLGVGLGLYLSHQIVIWFLNLVT